MIEVIDIPGVENIQDDQIIVHFEGTLNSSHRATLAESLEDYKLGMKDNGKKLFKIFMELALNIAYYSDERDNSLDEGDSGVGQVLIYRDKTGYFVHAVNKVLNNKLVYLSNKCRKINTLDKVGLRQYKLEMSMLPRSRNGGANIGLIQVALVSENPLRFKNIPIDSKFSYFALTVRVS